MDAPSRKNAYGPTRNAYGPGKKKKHRFETILLLKIVSVKMSESEHSDSELIIPVRFRTPKCCNYLLTAIRVACVAGVEGEGEGKREGERDGRGILPFQNSLGPLCGLSYPLRQPATQPNG